MNTSDHTIVVEDEESGEQPTLVLENGHPLNISFYMHDYSGQVEPTNVCLVDKYCQTDFIFINDNHQDSIETASKECQTDLPPVPTLTTELSFNEMSTQSDLPELCIEDIKNNDEDVMFFTGFPTFMSFMLMFNSLKQRASRMSYWKGEKWNREKKYQTDGKEKPGPKRKLRLIDEFFLVFMRLRLGLLEEDIARRFRISVSTCSSIWRTWVRFLSQEMVPLLLFWPSKAAIQSNMPDCFKLRYPNTRVILDCTEIKTETPESTKAKSLLYSNYKSHMTWKVLVGITPSGVPSLVSECYSGSTSDKEITRLSGVIEQCNPGDAIMCDKGFLIESLTTPKNVSIIRPTFKRKNTKFTRREVEETRRIANLRIHVEREMQRIKLFRILNGVMPICSHDTATDVFRICTAMTSLYPCLVQN